MRFEISKKTESDDNGELIKKIIRLELWKWVCANMIIVAVLTIAYCIVCETITIPWDHFQIITVFSIVTVWLFFAEDQRNHPLEPPPEMSSARHVAMYPPPPKQWIKDSLDEGDFMLGKTTQGRYVAVPMTEDHHWSILGATGAHKTTAYIGPLLLTNTCSAFVLDPKGGELHKKYARIGDPNCRVFNPRDRGTWGYDPLYNLHEGSSMQDIKDTVGSLVSILIPMTADVKDPFWIEAAQAYLKATLCYIIHRGTKNIIDAVEWLKSKPAKEIIKEVLDNSPKTSYPYMLLVNHNDYASDTLGSIIGQVDNGIMFLLDENVKYAMRENPRKISPLDLEIPGTKIFCSVDINDLKKEEYRTLVKLMISQCMEVTLSRDLTRIDEYQPVLYVLEELSVYLQDSSLPILLLALREMRGFKCRIICVFQSRESLEGGGYTEAQVTDLLCQTDLIVLDCGKSKATLELVADLVGNYFRKNRSQSGTGKDRRINVSYEEKPVLDISDLRELGMDCLVITKDRYMRLRKNPDYLDPWLRRKKEEIEEHNRAILEVQRLALEQKKNP